MAASRTDYGISQKVVHWLMAIGIMLDLNIAQKFGGEMLRADRIESRVDHATLGTIITVLLVIRIYLRWKNGSPALPADMSQWQKTFAHLAHWALYILMAALVITGILSAMNADSLINPFGVLIYSDGTGNQSMFLFIRTIHELITNAIIALIVVHVLAALYHLLIVRDGITQRMLKFWRSEKTPV